MLNKTFLNKKLLILFLIVNNKFESLNFFTFFTLLLPSFNFANGVTSPTNTELLNQEQSNNLIQKENYEQSNIFIENNAIEKDNNQLYTSLNVGIQDVIGNQAVNRHLNNTELLNKHLQENKDTQESKVIEKLEDKEVNEVDDGEFFDLKEVNDGEFEVDDEEFFDFDDQEKKIENNNDEEEKIENNNIELFKNNEESNSLQKNQDTQESKEPNSIIEKKEIKEVEEKTDISSNSFSLSALALLGLFNINKLKNFIPTALISKLFSEFKKILENNKHNIYIFTTFAILMYDNPLTSLIFAASVVSKQMEIYDKSKMFMSFPYNISFVSTMLASAMLMYHDPLKFSLFIGTIFLKKLEEYNKSKKNIQLEKQENITSDIKLEKNIQLEKDIILLEEGIKLSEKQENITSDIKLKKLENLK